MRGCRGSGSIDKVLKVGMDAPIAGSGVGVASAIMPKPHPNETALLHAGGRPGLWGNLGLWPARDYAQACERLAKRVAALAGPLDGARVLSPGCGQGEELALWTGRHGAASAIGIDAWAPPACGGPLPPSPWGPRLLHGDANEMAELAGTGFDALLCVDAAYHFSPRRAWLDQAFTVLRPGGALVFCDLLLETRWVPAGLLRLVLAPLGRAAGIGLSDLRSPAAACARVAEAGFTDVRLERLDEAVLDGFVAFVAAQQVRLGGMAQSAGWRRVAATARLLRALRPLGLGYAVLVARRPDAARPDRAPGARVSPMA